MSEPNTTEPATIRAGDAVSWCRDLPLYLPADGWALKYRLLWQVAPAAAISSAAYNITQHLVGLTAAETAAFQTGRATMVGWVERTDERVTLTQLQVDVLPDLTAATSLDGRSANERALTDARAALAAYVSGGQSMVEEYVILNRRMKFRDLAQLENLIKHYEREVAKDNARAAALQGVSPGRIYTRF
jgi:hypothetical protein